MFNVFYLKDAHLYLMVTIIFFFRFIVLTRKRKRKSVTFESLSDLINICLEEVPNLSQDMRE